MPNFNQYAGPLVKDPVYDPGNKYTMAWQSGYTGIGYNTDEIKEDITSVEDLFDPEVQGQDRHDVRHAGPGEHRAAGDRRGPGQVDARRVAEGGRQAPGAEGRGLVRNYYDQSYINALENGDIVITQAWSGDIFQANLVRLQEPKFVIPTGGRDALDRQHVHPALRGRTRWTP